MSTFKERTFQLLMPAELVELPKLLNEPRYVMQEKKDGTRRLLDLVGGVVTAVNRSGAVPVAENIRQALLTSPFKDLTLDGELVGDTFWAFDILRLDGADTRQLPYRERLEILEQTVGLITSYAVVIVATAHGPRDKRNMLKRVRAENREGVAFKDLEAPYTTGRKHYTQYKLKFHESATLRVIAHNEQRSVQVETEDGVFVGDCSIPVNWSVPPIGSLVEVRYLYAGVDTKHLFHPVYLGPRDDKQEADEVDSLKLKAS